MDHREKIFLGYTHVDGKYCKKAKGGKRKWEWVYNKGGDEPKQQDWRYLSDDVEVFCNDCGYVDYKCKCITQNDKYVTKSAAETKPKVVSVDNGHGTLNYKRHCPWCGSPTILHDSGWEYCDEFNCGWSHR